MSARRAAVWLAATLPFVLLSGPLTAAEYRTNLPTVLDRPEASAPTADPAPQAATIRADFARGYANAGSPRLAVYWNRPFSARLSQWVAFGRLRIDRTASVTGQLDDQDGGDQRLQLDSAESGKVVLERNAGQDARARRLDPLAAAEFEAGFTRPLLASGADLVDRAVILRVTDSNIGRGTGPGRLDDAQLVETEALKSFADLLVQITMLDDTDAPLDTAFQVKVTRIADGGIIANLVTRGRDTTDTQKHRWQATAGSYEKKAQTESVRVSALAQHVALETMQALAQRWR
ncbi:hypothetical protein [Rhodovibrio salinarum]|uniref:Lipoprotein n=1 Tax=Rhodovibrio salinarum TaxID=1087 RepID=A0A934QEI3_9PROT|nr:hypothetical protein [Rhodovibrio salinarum]MBK1695706.1 hypothetical protein [Rhodovibrio salinarum]